MRPIKTFLLLSLSLAVYLASTTSFAQQTTPTALPTPTPTVAPDSLESIADARKTLSKEKDNLQTLIKNAEEAGNNELKARLEKERNLYSYLDLIYFQSESALQTQKDLSIAKEKVLAEKEAWNKAPTLSQDEETFTTYDYLRNALASEEDELYRTELLTKAAQESIQNLRSLVENRESTRRSARERVETLTNEAERPQVESDLRCAVIESNIAKQLLRARQAEAENSDTAHDISRIRADLTTLKIKYLSTRVKMTDEDLKTQTGRLEDQEQQLRKSLDATKSRLTSCERNYFDANRKLGAIQSPDVQLLEEVESYRVCRDQAQNEIALSSEKFWLLSIQKDLWNKRFSTQNNALTKKEINEVKENSNRVGQSFESRSRMHNAKLGELGSIMTKTSARYDALKDEAPAGAKFVKDQLASLQRSMTMYSEQLASLQATKLLAQKLQGDLGVLSDQTNIKESLDRIWVSFLSIWSYELLTVDDRPITVHKIFLALIFIFAGIWISRKVSSYFGEKLLPRFGLRPGEVAALESLVFYILIIFFSLTALQIVNVPLTVFTVLGGAVAIGVGFGSQNIMNNFISGIILLLERPIRVGDLVEVEGLQGRVQHIGARSTRVLTGDNIDLVVPNSLLLEKNVVNWTLSDEKARAQISVCVEYGHDPEFVNELLLRAVRHVPRVLSFPDPFAVLYDFGDNGRVFKVFFWISMNAANNRLLIESDVRCQIERLFAENGIGIPFPRRETRLVTSEPLEVRIAK